MENQTDATTIFREILGPYLEIMDNTTDVVYLPSSIKFIEEEVIRENLRLDQDEEILFFRDTSFWDNVNQGLVITDFGLNLLPDNDFPDNLYFFAWENIIDVNYSNEDIIIVLESEGELYEWPINKNCFYKEAKHREIMRVFTTAFREIIENEKKM